MSARLLQARSADFISQDNLNSAIELGLQAIRLLYSSIHNLGRISPQTSQGGDPNLDDVFGVETPKVAKLPIDINEGRTLLQRGQNRGLAVSLLRVSMCFKCILWK